jgi:hypothetical protein
VVHNYEGRTIPTNIWTCLLRLHYAIPISKRRSKRTLYSPRKTDEQPTGGVPRPASRASAFGRSPAVRLAQREAPATGRRRGQREVPQ